LCILLGSMGVVEIRDQVAGLPDFEFQDLPRTRPVTYTLTLPPGASAAQPARGLLFCIPGFGQDNDVGYAARLRQGLAEAHGYACLSVDYHAIHARPAQGCNITIAPEGLALLRLLCFRHGVALDERDIMATLQTLSSHLTEATTIRALLEPPHEEYQNFGVLQALDHLVVLHRLIDEGLPCDFANVVLVGSSHGGYIAHLVAKFAPNSINAVIDNSSYTRPPLQYLGLFPEFHLSQGHLHVGCCVTTRWQFRQAEQPGFFGLPQQLIRDTAFPPHLAQMRARSQRLPRYFCFNSVDDPFISPIRLKRYQQRQLQAMGAECVLKEVTAADLDGKLFKTLDHGMNASLRGLCDLILPQVATRPTTLDHVLGTTLEYDGFDQRYLIQHVAGQPGVTASILSNQQGERS
jgi:hypothetical protein